MKDLRKFKLIYVDEGLTNEDNVDGDTSEWTVDEILEMVNDDEVHSDDFTPYDTSDWIEGVLEFSSYDLILERGDVLKWTDPDDGLCSGDATVKATVRLTGGFGEDMSIVVTDKGEVYANELS